MREFTLYKFVIPICLLATALFSSCDVSDSDGFSDTYSYQLQKKGAIITDSTSRPAGEDSTISVLNFSVKSGDNNVFIYKHNQNPPEGVMDGGYSETLAFQIPANTDQFELSDSTFGDATTLYRRSCFCPYSGVAFEVTSGTISGQKISSQHWVIDTDIMVETLNGTYEVNFKESFHSK